jgi:hypothetical protein
MKVRKDGLNAAFRDRLQYGLTIQPRVGGTHDFRQPFFAHVANQDAGKIDKTPNCSPSI